MSDLDILMGSVHSSPAPSFSASLSFSQDEVNYVDNPGPDQRYPGSQATITGSQRPGVWRLQSPPVFGRGAER